MPSGSLNTRYRLLLDLAREVTAQRDLGDVLTTTFASLRQLLEFGGGSIALVDDDGWISFAATDPPATAEAMAMRIKVGDGIVGRIVERGEPVYVRDIHTDPDVTEERRQRSVSAGVVAWFGVPLITEGRAIGVLQIDAPQRDAWGEDDRLLLMSFTPIVAAAVQNARLYARERAAVQRLQELDRRHRDFVAMVSHELRTPLTTIAGYSETILTHHDVLGFAGVVDLVGRIKASGDKLGALVEQLLGLSVLQRGDLRLALGPAAVRPLVDAAVAAAVPGERKVDVHVPDGLPFVVTDGDRLAQVLAHLVGNALKFSPDDTAVEVGARLDGDALVLHVRDHGPGIAPADRERVFERFVQLDGGNTRAAGGFGLGLYVARELCAALGATIAVEAPDGGGARLVVRVPLAPGLDVQARAVG